MKKALSIILLLCLVMSTVSIISFALSTEDNNVVSNGYNDATEPLTEAPPTEAPPTEAPPTEVTSSGKTGDCTWRIKGSVLTISGYGKIEDYGYYSIYEESYHYDTSPWEAYKDTIETVIIEDGVTNIGNFSFYRFSNLKNITIPNTVTDIGGCAFCDCSALSTISIPASVNWVGKRAFDGCTGLTGVYISDVEAWCKVFFQSEYSEVFHRYCSGTNPLEYAHNLYLNNELVTDLVIPDSVTYLRYDVFRNCSNLKSVTLNQSGVNVFRSAFYGCNSIETIILNDSVTSIPSSKSSEGRTPQGFSGYKSIKSITIPISVMSIDIYAFEGCSGLTSITIDPGNRLFDSRNNCNAIIDIRTNKLVLGCQSSVIPDTVKSIGNDAFYHCTGLTDIVIPDSVNSIGDYAFCGCTDLTNITIGESVNSIGDYAFSGCTNLTNVTIGESVNSIGDYTFFSCNNLTSINIPSSVRSIGNFAFYNCSNINRVIIPASVTSIGEKALGYYSNEKRIENFKIFGYDGSQAYDYAWYNYLDFVALSNVLGDTDGNGELDVVDGTFIQRYLVDIPIPYTREQMMSGDVDGSGDLELTDVTAIQYYLVNMKTPYKIGEPIQQS